MARVKEQRIETLIPDNKNFNKGTEYGDHLLDESLRKFGLGRSILLDKNDRIIAGNKATEKAAELGFEKVLIIETDGNTLVAVKRNDIDLDSQMGRELALADNATSKANLSWDEELIMQEAEALDFDPEKWGVSFSMQPKEGEQEESKKNPQLVIKCDNISRLSLLLNELQNRGFDCELRE